ncbi:hypothetical protein F0365_05635 [Nonlabens sp. Ci31]|uniref:hypothetical protein n=1 Tax=Nonlabens sp. Ci31 TaxID=2608253 RepID=UPI0014639F7E|nr:hypothetical protein [Nonlabens sp. Ci31]QJP33923.1 hypothetical protein F0365_05635 [Nonlabens sp. Ci31]
MKYLILFVFMSSISIAQNNRYLERKGLRLNKAEREAMLKAQKEGRTSIVSDSIYKASFGNISGVYDFESDNVQQGFGFNQKINYQVINELENITKETVYKNVLLFITQNKAKILFKDSSKITYEIKKIDFFKVDTDILTNTTYDLDLLVTYDFKDKKIRTTYEKIELNKNSNQNIIIDNYFFERGDYISNQNTKYDGLVFKLLDVMNSNLKQVFSDW